MENKRILYAASTMRHIESFHLDYIEALRSAGHTVKIMARGQGADFDIPFEKRMLSLSNLDSVFRIRRILRNEKFDVIILNTALAAFLVRLACPSKSRPRVVNIVHGYLFSENISPARARFLLLCEKIVRGKTDSIITMNREDYDSAANGGLCLGKVYPSRGMGARLKDEVSNFENLRAEFAPAGSFVMCFVGELSQRKNQEFLIKSLTALSEELPEVTLWLIGEGEERQRLGDLSRELGVAEKIIFLGHRSDACDFIRAADLYVTAASVEGLPHNVLEAMGAGKTVLASDIKGHRDLIDDGVDGFLYQYGNMGEFVNKTCQIYDKVLVADEKSPVEKYEAFSKDSVFDETLGVICAACEISCPKLPKLRANQRSD